ncbi:biotin transporter BioY [Dehalobacterium formicoaceticum]|uniref:biotin transporter BioY n=1 Tax=Dehalobacterium formicoaceticum TaxID=51515 RepID=UPI000B7EEA80|nr:biotin transporter BioY [Dehalobacterium formicoaceticum]
MMKINEMSQIAMFTALIAVLSQISLPLPFSPVPMTLQTFAVFFTAMVLGSRKGALVMILYTFIGAAGFPVFSQGKAGLPVLLGPTGGYIFGFILAAWIIGKIIEGAEQPSLRRSLIALLCGVTVIYLLGMGQLKLLLDLSIKEAFVMGVLPYLALELIKVTLAAYLGCAVRKAVVKAFPETV